jgi:hypothetical protein
LDFTFINRLSVLDEIAVELLAQTAVNRYLGQVLVKGSAKGNWPY